MHHLGIANAHTSVAMLNSSDLPHLIETKWEVAAAPRLLGPVWLHGKSVEQQ